MRLGDWNLGLWVDIVGWALALGVEILILDWLFVFSMEDKEWLLCGLESGFGISVWKLEFGV